MIREVDRRCPAVLDTNGDGQSRLVGPNRISRVDPTKDHRVTFGCYAIAGQREGREHLVFGDRQ